MSVRVRLATAALLLFGPPFLSARPAAAQPTDSSPEATYISPYPEKGGHFSSSLATVGDVNGDDISDLVVGAHGESYDGISAAGRVYLLSGASGRVIHTFSSPNPSDDGRFGKSVAGVGDTNGDGIPDLLIGAPNETPGGVEEAGRAYLLSGGQGNVLQTLSSTHREENGHFGLSVAGVGDLNRDGTPELLVGATEESPRNTEHAGRAYLFSGAEGTTMRTLTSPNIEKSGRFGITVAEVRGSYSAGTTKLAIGAGGEGPGGVNGAGRVYLFNENGGLSQTLTSPNPEKNGNFGTSVTEIGDIDGNNATDLLIGAYGESPAGMENAGRAYVLDSSNGQFLRTLVSPNVEEYGSFGESVEGIGDLDGDGTADLMVGAPWESTESRAQAGRAYLISGATGQLIQTLRSSNGRNPGSFGTSITDLRQFEEDAKPLLVGADREDTNGVENAGRIHRFEVNTKILKEIRDERKQKGIKPLRSVTLSIQKIGQYNLNQGAFPITIQDTIYEVEIPAEEARSFGENWQDAKVVGYMQLNQDLDGYRYLNLEVTHPVTGSRYSVGPQEDVRQRPVATQKQVDPDHLPETSASVDFTEPSGNGRLDGGETATVRITVQNTGNGPARQVEAQIRPAETPHLYYPASVSLGTVAPDSSQTETVQIQADREIQESKVSLEFAFDEAKGFAPSPVRLQFETQKFIPPELTVADVGIDDASGNGVIEPGEVVDVTARIRNASRGAAEDVSTHIHFGKNVFATPKTRQSFDLGDLGPGEHQDIQFMLVTNQQAESVPVTLDLTEKYGEFGKQGIKLPLAFDKPTDQITEVQVEGQETEVAVKTGDQLSVDIETNIPSTPMNRPDAIAVVMGIQSYSSAGAPDVEYARRDARYMREYLTQTLGFQEENILPRNPDGRMTFAEMRTLIQEKLPSYVKEGISEVFVYYSGHGAPSTGEEKRAYLVPSDTDPNFVSGANAYRLSQFYEDLSALSAESVTVALDACFTGQAGSGEMMLRQASPLALSVENPLLGIENATGFLASGPEQVANWYPEKKHGMFTYFFLKGLKGKADLNDNREVTVQEMKRYLTDKESGVPYWSGRVHQRTQMPQVVSQNPGRVLVRYGPSETHN